MTAMRILRLLVMILIMFLLNMMDSNLLHSSVLVDLYSFKTCYFQNLKRQALVMNRNTYKTLRKLIAEVKNEDLKQ